MTSPFPLVERAVKELIETRYPQADGKVGGSLSYEKSQELYVWIGLIPGGTTNEIEGEWIVDIDVFANSYSVAMTHALALEAILIGARHTTSVMRLDNCTQNIGPAERFWDDESVFRIGATYVFTARRPGSA